MSPTPRLPETREATLQKQAAATPTPEQEQANPAETKQSNRAEPFSQAELDQHWKVFAERLKEQGNMSAHIAMIGGYKLEGNTKIIMKLSNPGQLQFLNDARTELMQFLRDALQNDQLTIDISLQKEELAPAKAYTPGEKFEEMVKKNEALAKLKDKLGLDPYF